LAHFGRGSFNFKQVVVKWFPLLQIWHLLNIVEEDGASGLGTFPLKKLMNVLFKVVTYFSIMVSETPSSCSYFKGSYGVFPSFPNTLSNYVAAPTNSSIFVKVLTMHNF
jgi:hypothetical protein